MCATIPTGQVCLVLYLMHWDSKTDAWESVSESESTYVYIHIYVFAFTYLLVAERSVCGGHVKVRVVSQCEFWD